MGLTYEEFELGAIYNGQARTITEADVETFAGLSGDFNPIHTDPEFANKVGLGGTIAHGMYIMAQLGRLCSNWAHPAQIKSFGVKFKGMSRPGQSLTLSGKVKRKKEENGEKLLMVAVEARADDGEVKVAGDLVVVAD